MIRSLFFSLLALNVIIAQLAWASDNLASDAISKLTTAISRADKRFRSGEEARTLTSIKGYWNTVLDKFSTIDGHISQGFVSTLLYDAEVLTSALDTSSSDVSRKLAVVNIDLQSKANYSSGQLSATGESFGDIEVVVTTLNQDREVSGYYIRCRSAQFPNIDSPRFTFNNPTNPKTTGFLPPGYYVMWAERQRVETEHRSITVYGSANPQDVKVEVDSP